MSLFKTMDDPEGEDKKFCKLYGIKKVADLPKSKFKKAVKYLEDLIGDAVDDGDKPFYVFYASSRCTRFRCGGYFLAYLLSQILSHPAVINLVSSFSKLAMAMEL